MIDKTFKLIKEFPGSPKLGTFRNIKCTTELKYSNLLAELWRCENSSEYWKEIDKKVN